MKPYSPADHRPSPVQEQFLRLDAEEVFYGGAAGGSKTDSLILAALQYIDRPRYSAGLFRLTEADLYKPGAIGERCQEWFGGTAARWVQKNKAWRFPSGATIHLGYGETAKELEQRYQGPEFQFIGCEELGQWAEDAYLYLWTRLRRKSNVHAPLRMRAAGNPGGRGAEWIRRRFIESAKHLETGMGVKEYLKLRKEGKPLPKSRLFLSPPSAQAVAVAEEFGREAQGAYFVPAFARDNPGLILAEYMANLARASPAVRDQLEHGDWWAAAGGDLFKEEWFKYADEAPAGLVWIRAWDLAATEPHDGNLDPDWTAGVRMAVENIGDENASKRVWISNVARFRKNPGMVEKEIKKVATADGKRVKIYIEEEGGASGKNTTNNYVAKVLFGWMVHGERKTGDKLGFWEPLAADAENGLVTLVSGSWTQEFVHELCTLKRDMSHGHDDQADAAGLARSKLINSTDLEKLRGWRKR